MNTFPKLASLDADDRIGWAETLLQARRVTESDVRLLDEAIFPLGLVAGFDADALIRIERHLLDKAPTWSGFFVRSLVDFVVWGELPTGTISEARARWVIERLDRLPIDIGDRWLVSLRDEAVSMPTWFRFAIHHRLGTSGSGMVERTVAPAWMNAA